MPLLSESEISLVPGLLVLGLGLLISSLFRPDQPLMRAMLFACVIGLTWRYVGWRYSETIPSFGWKVRPLLSWGFFLLEAATALSSSIAFVILSRTRDRMTEATLHDRWWLPTGRPDPQVDVLIATYNEDAEILERTIIGALAVEHSKLRVWVLDDSRRPWLKRMSEELGAHYLTRADNTHAKAGNINNALRRLSAEAKPPDYVVVLDADFVPHTNFVRRALALFHAPDVGLVQTPQHFFNADPIQYNLGLSRSYPDEQRFFFDYIQPARDAWGIAFCCGTSSMMRWTALEALGGFPTNSVTEDFLITLRMQELGWRTVYLNEPLTEGLAPEGLKEYITQRGRWCLGLMQIIRGANGPFARNRLRLVDRIGLVDSLLYWSTTYPFRLACLLAPLLYWFLGVPLVNASVEGVVSNFLPYYVGVVLLLNWISGGLIVPVLNDVGQLLGATEIVRATYQGLVHPRNQSFKVTAKGGDRTRTVVQWPLLRLFALVFVATVLGLSYNLITDYAPEGGAGDGTVIIVFWSVYNLFVLAIAMLVAVELPRDDQLTRQSVLRVEVRDGRGFYPAWLLDLTPTGGWVHGPGHLAPGEGISVQIPDLGRLDAIVAEAGDGAVRIAFSADATLRAGIARFLHTREGASGTLRTNAFGLLSGLTRRIVWGSSDPGNDSG
jgi:cellulose synthase (UDP-forming)